MRENLLNCPEDTHSWFTAWKLYTAHNGCYVAKRDIRYVIGDTTSAEMFAINPQQIAYSNDRFRLMHEMYGNAFFCPTQTPRWMRSTHGEILAPYACKWGIIDKWTIRTYDSFNHEQYIKVLGIDLSLHPDQHKVEKEKLGFKARAKGLKFEDTTTSEKLHDWMDSKKFISSFYPATPNENPFSLSMGIDLAMSDSKPIVFSGKGMSDNLSNSLQSELEQDVQKMKEYYNQVNPKNLESEKRAKEWLASDMLRVWHETQAFVARDKSTLSDQDLESLANSKVTFGLTKDNIAHIESSLAAKDYDATYAHHFWVQMGKDCNWEPLTLALYYFRCRDKEELLTEEYFILKGFKWSEEHQALGLNEISVERMNNNARSWKVSYTLHYGDSAQRSTLYVKYVFEMEGILENVSKFSK